MALELSEILSAILTEVMPGGRDADALDELFLLAADMTASNRLRYGVQFTLKEDSLVVFLLGPVVREAMKYCRETESREELLGIPAYKRLAAEKAEEPGSYVRDPSARAWFSGEVSGKDMDKIPERKRLRGVAVDPAVLEETLEIDSDIWNPPFEGG